MTPDLQVDREQDQDRAFTRRMVRTVLTVTITAIVLAALWAAREALMLIYVSALIAMGFSPLVRIIQHPGKRGGRSRVPRVMAILVIYVTVLGIIVLVGLAVLPPLVEQASSLWRHMPQYFSSLQEFLLKHRMLSKKITLLEAVQNAPAGTSSSAVNWAATLLGALWSLLGGVLGLITILILSFYLLIEAEPLFNYATRFVPEPKRALFATASREAVSKVSAWLRAQLVLAGVMGVSAAVGLGFMGEPYFYVVALVAAIGETIPVIGPIIGGMTAVAVAFTSSPKLALMVGVYFLILHQLEANILVPKIMERRVGVSPVTVVIALLIGGALWGLVGAILAIPTAAILSVVVDELTAGSGAQIIRAG